MPDVSICIPAYEEPDFLVKALASVFDQTYINFEVIVTDDSRSAAVESAVKRWATDPRLRYVRNHERLGSPENWNKAIALAEGRLIKMLHHDDWFASKKSLQQYVSLLESQPEATFAFSGARACDAEGHLLFQHTPSAQQIEALRKDPRCLFKANFVGAPSATLFRRQKGFRFDPALKWFVDVDAYIRILKSGESFAYTPEPLINITASAPHQVTSAIQADPVIQFLESAYLYRSLNFGPRERLRYWPVFMRLARGLNTDSLAVVSSDPKAKDCPLEVRASLILQKLRLALKRTLANGVARLSRRKRPDERERTSYSQCGEDLIIDFIFMWLGRKEVSYLDIGANDPSWLNNTYFFYLKGYNGVLIEPDEQLCKLLSARRPRDRCLNVAVGVDGKPSAKMYVMTSRTLNTLISSQATEYEGYGREKVERIVEVPQREINEILDREFDRTPNLVSLDVEGLDFEILKKWDFARFRPEVFCVETLTFTQNGTERKLTDIIDFMNGRGYFTYADTYINTIFVSNEAWSSRLGTG